jgi:motility quorum-sensing regulator/GCU-specific mRNA interferase toxin
VHISRQVSALPLARCGVSGCKESAAKGITPDMDAEAALNVVLGLQRGMLFKSMTTHSDVSIWQDVYHAPCPDGKMAYIKVKEPRCRPGHGDLVQGALR